MKKNYEYIIWDWNGTLLNDCELCVSIANKILDERGLPGITKEDYKDKFGFPITDYYNKIGINLEDENFEQLTAFFISTYMDGIKNCDLHEPATSVLESFQSQKIKQLMLTASHTDLVHKLLDEYAIKHHFDYVAGLDNHRAESKVERGEKLIHQASVDPTKAVIIGDTTHDHKVSQQLGIDCVLVGSGHQSFARLKACSDARTWVIPDLSELDMVIGNY